MAADPPTGTLEIQLVGVKPFTGTLYVAVHSKPGTFPKADSAQLKVAVKASQDPQTVKVEHVPYGTWAVSVWHDVNDDNVLQTGIFGIPKEPMGVSNDAKGRFGPPKFDDAKFELKEATKKLVIHLEVP